jgi:topoisomerase IA-like protein
MLTKLKINILGWLGVTPKEVVFEKIDTVVIKKAAKKAPAKKAPAKKAPAKKAPAKKAPAKKAPAKKAPAKKSSGGGKGSAVL